jgi:hypothetical protein
MREAGDHLPLLGQATGELARGARVGGQVQVQAITPVIRYLPTFSGAFITIVTLPSPLSSGHRGQGDVASSAVEWPSVVESENCRRLPSFCGAPVSSRLGVPP